VIGETMERKKVKKEDRSPFAWFFGKKAEKSSAKHKTGDGGKRT